MAARDASIREMYVEWKWSAPEIAEELGMHRTSVLIALQRTGTPRRSRGSKYPVRAIGIRPTVASPGSGHDTFVDYSAYRKQYRETLRIERMLASLSRRKDWAA